VPCNGTSHSRTQTDAFTMTSHADNLDLRLLLVGGTGRSGTSFVYRQLLNNREMVGFEEFESQLFTSNQSLIDLYDRYTRSYSPERFNAVCRVFSEQTRARFIALYRKRPIRRVFRERQIDNALKDYIQGLQQDRMTVDNLQPSFSQRTARLFHTLFELDDASDAETTLLEKTPHNVLFFPQIRQIFPSAKIIHVVRDPRAVAESLMRQSWGPSSYPEAFTWIRQILETWIRQYQSGAYSADDLLCLRAEDLLTGQTYWEDRIRDFTGCELTSLDLNASATALDGWREAMSDADFELANTQLRGIMHFFSYDPAITEGYEQSRQTHFELP